MADSPDCAWILTTGPTLEPFTLAEAKAQIRSVQNQEDGLVASYIKAARTAAEEYMGRALLTQSWTLSISEFVPVIPLPMAAPLASVTSVKYYDTSGVQQTLATSTYTVDTRSRPGRIALAADQTWPSVQSGRLVDRIQIEYVAGYTSSALIPESIRQGMRIYIGYLDADRDGMQAGAKQALEVAKMFWTDRVFWSPPSY
jgi:uncharacterized phiE125 gp8 family phage protein